jgi:hypothetical protein
MEWVTVTLLIIVILIINRDFKKITKIVELYDTKITDIETRITKIESKIGMLYQRG